MSVAPGLPWFRVFWLILFHLIFLWEAIWYSCKKFRLWCQTRGLEYWLSTYWSHASIPSFVKWDESTTTPLLPACPVSRWWRSWGSHGLNPGLLISKAILSLLFLRVFQGRGTDSRACPRGTESFSLFTGHEREVLLVMSCTAPSHVHVKSQEHESVSENTGV